jgi:hypothetical protein
MLSILCLLLGMNKNTLSRYGQRVPQSLDEFRAITIEGESIGGDPLDPMQHLELATALAMEEDHKVREQQHQEQQNTTR